MCHIEKIIHHGFKPPKKWIRTIKDVYKGLPLARLHGFNWLNLNRIGAINRNSVGGKGKVEELAQYQEAFNKDTTISWWMQVILKINFVMS
jgi:hypothetical protein